MYICIYTFLINIFLYIYKENIYIKKIYIFIFIYTQSILVFDIWSSFVASIEDAKPVLMLNRFYYLPYPNRLCACSKTSVVPTLNQPLQNRLCIDSFWAKSSFVVSIGDAKPVLILNRFCIKAGFVHLCENALESPFCRTNNHHEWILILDLNWTEY